MAKKMEMMMTCPPSSCCGPKCIVLGIIAALLGAAGLWMLVSGVMMQSQMLPWSSVLLWYTGGFLLWCIAKMAKWKACPMCKQM